MVRLVLVEGSVAFEYEGYTTDVRPGELVEFNKTTRETYHKNTNPGFYTSWRYGELMFDKMTFEELAIRLERNFNVTFVFQNEKLKKETFGGTFRHYDSLETILKVISTSMPIRFRIEKNVVYLNTKEKI
jgi:ferric-dicitrate binding protein FerR (iron transport regulator)